MDKIKNIVKIMFLFCRQLNVNLDMSLIVNALKNYLVWGFFSRNLHVTSSK